MKYFRRILFCSDPIKEGGEIGEGQNFIVATFFLETKNKN